MDQATRDKIIAVATFLLAESLETGFGIGELRYREIVDPVGVDLEPTAVNGKFFCGDSRGQN